MTIKETNIQVLKNVINALEESPIAEFTDIFDMIIKEYSRILPEEIKSLMEKQGTEGEREQYDKVTIIINDLIKAGEENTLTISFNEEDAEKDQISIFKSVWGSYMVDHYKEAPNENNEADEPVEMYNFNNIETAVAKFVHMCVTYIESHSPD